jgi:hypothetical protein
LLFGDLPPPQLPSTPQELAVNNRILANVNGKTISVYDVMKKMDLFLRRNYPQYADDPTSRYQYFSSSWRDTLDHMINEELMMADAESREIKVKDGEVREAIQERFGPNVMSSLDQLGLTYDEARKMVHQDKVLERMQWWRVTAKAIMNINTQDVKDAYVAYCQKNPAKDEWEYQVLSIRAPDPGLSQSLSEKGQEILKQGEASLVAISEALRSNLPPESPVTINLSQDFSLDDSQLSSAHRDILVNLKQGAMSPPIKQISQDGSIAYRFFHLKKHTQKNLPTFDEISNQLKEDLINEKMQAEMIKYVSKLRSRFDHDNSLNIPSDFQPFLLK